MKTELLRNESDAGGLADAWSTRDQASSGVDLGRVFHCVIDRLLVTAQDHVIPVLEP